MLGDPRSLAANREAEWHIASLPSNAGGPSSHATDRMNMRSVNARYSADSDGSALRRYLGGRVP
jgi:hypothetical protein